MGTQTMGSQGAAGGGAVGGCGGGTQEPKSHAPTRQGSLYNLTLDEVQHQLGGLGKPLSSMNLDELLKSVWSVETNQGAGSGNGYYNPMPASLLPRQSSLTLSWDLSKKTVDEVWQDIQQARIGDNHDRRAHERQQTLGDITLEDFLVKAGVVAESSPVEKLGGPAIVPDQIVLPQQSLPPQAQWIPYQQDQHNNMMSVYMPNHPMQQGIPIGGNQIVEAVYPEPQMSMSPTALMGTLSDTQTPGRKRVASGEVVEKTVERRQKRMIKNRESAARSRARKQAYTHELENKVSRLEEENERLKRLKEVEKLLPSPPPEPKYQLRRTSSAGF